MNPEVQRTLHMLLDSAEKLGAAAWNQAPLVFHDIIVEGLIDGIASMIVAATLVGVARWLGMKGVALLADRYTERLGEIGCISATAAAIVGVTFLYHGAVQTLTCWLAPRAYIISTLK